MISRQVGHYRLDSLLGSGGMGEVYKAYDTRRERFVALKFLPEEFAGDQEYLSRFKRESHVAARLTEPHVIPIHDFGEVDGQLFIDMRLVDGADLGALLARNGRIAPLRAVHLISQVAEALDAAHADDLVHRDIKPSNILVTWSDFVYVVDFGLARSMGGQQTALTITGATIGTLHYMAPERFVGHHVDGRADVYSLACVLHECLTGEPPFSGKDLPTLMYAQLNSAPPPASGLVDGIPPALDAVIARGMAKDPEDRFPTAGGLAAAAREALLTETPVLPPMTELPAPPWEEAPAPPWEEAPGSTWDEMPPEPPDDGSAMGFYDSPTQTVPAVGGGEWGGPRPAEEPAGGPTGGPGRGDGWRRPRVLASAAAAAAALAVSAALVVMATTKPHAGGAPATQNKDGATRPGAAGMASSAPSLAVPTVAGKVRVGQTPSYVQVAPNGKFAYVANPGAGAITVLNTADDAVSGTIKIPQGQPQFVSFSPDSRTAYVSVYETRGPVHLVAFVNTATGTVTSTVPVDNRTPGPSTTSPDGRFLYVPNHDMTTGGPGGNIIDVIDTAGRRVTGRITVPPNPHWVVFGKNGRFYATDHMSTTVTVLNASTNQIIGEIQVGETPHSAALSPDGSRLAVTSFSGNEVFMVSTATDKEVAQIPVGRSPLDIAYSPDGRYLFTTDNEDNAVTVIDAADNRVIGEVPAGNAPTSISVLPNGLQAYVTDEGDGTIEILNIGK